MPSPTFVNSAKVRNAEVVEFAHAGRSGLEMTRFSGAVERGTPKSGKAYCSIAMPRARAGNLATSKNSGSKVLTRLAACAQRWREQNGIL